MSSINPGPAVTRTPNPVYPLGDIKKCAIVQTPTITPSPVNGNTKGVQVFPLSGFSLLQGDIVEMLASPPDPSELVSFPAVVGSDGNLVIGFANLTAGAITPAAGQYTLRITRVVAPAADLPPLEYMSAF